MSSKRKISLLLGILALLIAGGAVFYYYKIGKFKFKATGPTVTINNDRLIVNGATILPLGLWGLPADSKIPLLVGNKLPALARLKLPFNTDQMLPNGFNILAPVSPVIFATQRNCETVCATDESFTDAVVQEITQDMEASIFNDDTDSNNDDAEKNIADLPPPPSDPTIKVLDVSDPVVPGLWRVPYINQKEGLSDDCRATEPPSSDHPADPAKCKVRRAVFKSRNRNDVIGWFGNDEPNINKVNQPRPTPPDALIAGYNIAKAADPLKRPIWNNISPRATPVYNTDGSIIRCIWSQPATWTNCAWNNFDTVKPYNASLDIFSSHIFPIPPKNDISPLYQASYQNKNTAMVGQVVDIFKQIANSDKKRPFWMNIQGSQKKVWQRKAADPDLDVKPTYQEQRFMAYDALVHGAGGLIWFGVYGLEATDSAVKAITDTAKEIRYNRLIFLAAPSAIPVTFSTTNPGGAPILDYQGTTVHFMVKALSNSDKIYIVATNDYKGSVDARVTVPSGYKVYPYPASPPGNFISTQGAVYQSFTEHFETLGVRIYELIPTGSKSTPTIGPITY